VFGGNWIELPAGRYRVTPPADRIGHCQIEVDVGYVGLRGGIKVLLLI
jgi:hypothetical protein